MRDHFGAKMKASPDASAFAVVTQRIDMHGMAFRDAAAKVASIDTLHDLHEGSAEKSDGVGLAFAARPFHIRKGGHRAVPSIQQICV